MAGHRFHEHLCVDCGRNDADLCGKSGHTNPCNRPECGAHCPEPGSNRCNPAMDRQLIEKATAYYRALRVIAELSLGTGTGIEHLARAAFEAFPWPRFDDDSTSGDPLMTLITERYRLKQENEHFRVALKEAIVLLRANDAIGCKMVLGEALTDGSERPRE